MLCASGADVSRGACFSRGTRSTSPATRNFRVTCHRRHPPPPLLLLPPSAATESATASNIIWPCL
ncbi:hypothetical protein FKM82_010937 [Ascaphus truei]